MANFYERKWPFLSSVQAQDSPHKQPTTQVIHQTTKSNIHNSSEQYILQGNAYLAAAIQHAEEGNTILAEHLTKEANEKYQFAEDAKLAKKLQEEEL